MQIYFLRHADAEGCLTTDSARRLTPKGLEQAEKVGRFFERHGLQPGLVLTSPAVRAKQTAEGAFSRLGEEGIVECPWIACGMSPEIFLEEIRAFANFDEIVIVGHEPDFGETIAALVGLPDPSALRIRKASLTAIDLPRVARAAGSIEFSLPVRLM